MANELPLELTITPERLETALRNAAASGDNAAARAFASEIRRRRAPVSQEGVPAGFAETPSGLRHRVALKDLPELPEELVQIIQAQPGAETPLSKARALGSLGAPIQGAAKVLGPEANVRFDERLQDIVFDDPETGQTTLLNQPGIDLSDLAALSGEVPVVVGGVAGALGGAALGAAGGPLGVGGGAVAGETVGVFTGEMGKLIGGKALGAHDLSDEDMIIEAAKVAGVSTITGGFGLGLAKLGRRLVGRVKTGQALPRGLRDRIPPESLEAGLEDVGRLQGELGQRGIDLPVTTGQALRGVEPEVSTAVEGLEAGLARRPVGGPLRDIAAQQRTALEELQAGISRPFDRPGVDVEAIGRGVQREAAAGPRRGIATIEQRTEQAREAARGAAGRLDATAPIDAAEEARSVLTGQRTSLRERLSGEYGAINEQTGGFEADLSGLRAAGKRHKALQENDIFKSLSPDDPSLAAEAIAAGEQPASLGSVSRALSDVKAEIRSVRAGKSPRRQIVALEDFRDELQKARGVALEGNPDLARQVAEVDARYAKMKQDIDGSIIGELLQQKPGGGMRIRNEQVIDSILRNPTGAQKIAAIAKDPNYSEFNLDSVTAIKKGVLGRYRDTVIDPDTGIANAGRHKTFMRNNSTAMKEFFSPEEMTQLGTASRAAQSLKTAEAKERNVIAKINRSFGLRLDSYDSEDVLAKVANSPAKARRVKTILRRSPDKWRDFQAGTVRDFFNSVSSFDPQVQDQRLNVARLGAFLGNSKSRGAVQEVLGPQFIEDLGLLQRATRTVGRRPSDPGELAELARAVPEATVLTSLFRARFAPPLTGRGRAFSALLRFEKASVMRVVTNALKDPKALHEMMKLRELSPTSKKAAAILSGLGGAELAVQLRDIEKAE